MTSDAVLWHDLECGSYTADLALWRELAAAAEGPVLDVGAGTGRVALDLARAGFAVTALDHEGELLDALAARAARAGLDVATVAADARDFELGRSFGLVLAPMQTVQLLGGRAGRAAFLGRAAAHLAPAGRVACALAVTLEAFDAATAALPLPDMLEIGDRVLSSQPVRIRDDGGGWVIERVRQVVGPRGEVAVSDDRIRLDAVTSTGLEAEAAAAGLRPAARTAIAETAEHVGSDVVVLARA